MNATGSGFKFLTLVARQYAEFISPFNMQLLQNSAESVEWKCVNALTLVSRVPCALLIADITRSRKKNVIVLKLDDNKRKDTGSRVFIHF